jgi:hypothetical protein
LKVEFSGYDVVAALECLYYLPEEEQHMFVDKLVREHAGGIFILSAPIIGSNEFRTYYTHSSIERMFSGKGITLIEWCNLNVCRKASIAATFAAAAARLPFGDVVVRSLPEKWVYQRCYVARCPG